MDKLHGDPLEILLVEDNPDHVELIRRSLQDHLIANNLHHVSDGEQAMAYLLHEDQFKGEGSSPRPQLVLLDLRLPKVGGLEVLEKIKNNPKLQTIPVVILTSSEAEKDVTMAYKCKANSYLVKPVDFDQFTRMMKELGFYWLGWNRFPWLQGELSKS